MFPSCSDQDFTTRALPISQWMIIASVFGPSWNCVQSTEISCSESALNQNRYARLRSLEYNSCNFTVHAKSPGNKISESHDSAKDQREVSSHLYCSPTSGPWPKLCEGSWFDQNTSSSCSYLTAEGLYSTWNTTISSLNYDREVNCKPARSEKPFLLLRFISDITEN